MTDPAAPTGPTGSEPAAGLAHRLVARLVEREETLACAESLTGGLVAAAITSVPGASAVFRGGVVSYATEVKRDLLGVRAAVVVSPQCAEEMADGVRHLLGADRAIATTGVAGPDPQDGQPPGTVHIGLASADQVVSHRLDLHGDRASIRAQVVDIALAAMLTELE